MEIKTGMKGPYKEFSRGDSNSNNYWTSVIEFADSWVSSFSPGSSSAGSVAKRGLRKDALYERFLIVNKEYSISIEMFINVVVFLRIFWKYEEDFLEETDVREILWHQFFKKELDIRGRRMYKGVMLQHGNSLINQCFV